MRQDDNACSHPLGNCSSSRNVRVKRYFRAACPTHSADQCCRSSMRVARIARGLYWKCDPAQIPIAWCRALLHYGSRSAAPNRGFFSRVPRMPDRPPCCAGSVPALSIFRMWPDHVTARKKHRDVSVFLPRRYLCRCNHMQAPSMSAIADHLAMAAPPDFRT